MIEKLFQVGQVTINLTAYSGMDQYSDGPVEDQMLELARQQQGRFIDEKLLDSWPLLYHFSPLRENLVSWLPITVHENVLEIGSGCGAITGAFCHLAGKVDAVELSLKRSLINAHRHASCANLVIDVGNFQDIQLGNQYDWVSLIGVFEYARLFIQDDQPFLSMLKRIRSLLKPGGKMILAIENRFGMKYWAGCREDHTGLLFDSIQGYPGSNGTQTFSKLELTTMLEAAGYHQNRFYYPFPDYKMPASIYSDVLLPLPGSLRGHINNPDQSRLYLFDEGLAWDEVIASGQFSFFANSFLVMCS